MFDSIAELIGQYRFVHPNFDPVALDLGFASVQWYGLMYLIGFAAAYFLGRYRAKRWPQWNPSELDDIIFLGAMAVIVGGRLGYMVFYDWPYETAKDATDPWWEFIKIWDGGMSFHGGALAVVLAIAFYAWRSKRGFLQVADFVVPLAPLGIFAGRMGNFINQELWGRVVSENSILGVQFPKEANVPTGIEVPEGLSLPFRHPSQLYEAVSEGLLLFAILWLYSRKPRPVGSVAALFLFFYGVFRGFVEFFRKPDEGIDFLWGTTWLTEGMLLSIPMIIAGLALFVVSIIIGRVVETRATQ